jgi:hypothetical protein
MAARARSTLRRLLGRLRRVTQKMSPRRRGRELRKAQRDLVTLRRALASERVDRHAFDLVLDAYRVSDERLRRFIRATMFPALRAGEADPGRLAELEAMVPDPVHEDLILGGDDEYI